MSAALRTRFLDVALEAARHASDVIAAIYATDFAVEFKEKDDPVTRADKEANALICRALEAAFPGVPVVAEESPPESYAGYAASAESFYVDPLDGTREFVARNGQFCVMIGLAEQGRPTAGVVAGPALGRTFAGFVGDGPTGGLAFEVASDGSRRPLRVSSVNRLADAEVVISRSRKAPPSVDVVQALGVRTVTPFGSSGLKAARVAAAEADIYLQPGRAGMVWDLCAPQAIVEGAGGRVTDGGGAPYDLRKDLACHGGVLATNGVVHDELLQRLGVLLAERAAAHKGSP